MTQEQATAASGRLTCQALAHRVIKGTGAGGWAVAFEDAFGNTLRLSRDGTPLVFHDAKSVKVFSDAIDYYEGRFVGA